MNYVVAQITLALVLVCDSAKTQTQTFNVLALLPLVSPKNHQFDEAVLMSMARQGHRVTVYSQFPPDREHPRYRHVRLDEDTKFDYSFYDKRLSSWVRQDYATVMALNREQFTKSGAYVTNSDQFRTLKENIKRGKKLYDVVVTETLVGQEHLLLFAFWANAAVVVLQPFGRNIIVKQERPSGGELEHVPEASWSFSRDTTMVDNIFGMMYPLNDTSDYESKYLLDANVWLKSLYPNESPIFWDLRVLAYHAPTKLVFKNEHLSLGEDLHGIHPAIPVAGIHIDLSPPPLDQELQQLLDWDSNGFIMIDIETSDSRGPWFQQHFDSLKIALETLNYHAVWATHAFNNISINSVRALPEMPKSVIAHPNCKLLITDGALLSIQEAVYHGVPVLVAPQSYYQHYTAAYVVTTGMGDVMDPLDFAKAPQLVSKIQTMYKDDGEEFEYKKNALWQKRMFQHRKELLDRFVRHWLSTAVSGYRPATKPSPDTTSIVPKRGEERYKRMIIQKKVNLYLAMPTLVFVSIFQIIYTIILGIIMIRVIHYICQVFK